MFKKIIKYLQHPLQLLIESLSATYHLRLIHYSRILLVRKFLPRAQYILDLGGANSPLDKMGYKGFKSITIVDLPPTQRHADFKNAAVSLQNKVNIIYTDMIKLKGIKKAHYDLIWSGQSIEHISKKNAEIMLKNINKVLKRGGRLCLDTPNRLLTKIHTSDIGGGYVHPDHKIEYTPKALIQLVEQCGFSLVKTLGVCHMPKTVKKNKFYYSYFLLGQKISKDTDSSYIMYLEFSKY